MVITITKDNYVAEVEQATKPLIIDISASWCGPCQRMKPVFEQLARDLGHLYIFAEINVDESHALAMKFGVTSVPTFVFIKDNEIKGKERGYMSIDDLKEKIRTIFS